MSEGKFPTTSDYRIGVDIDLSKAHALSGEFMKAAKDGTLGEFMPGFMESVLGRKGVKAVLHEDEGHQADKYFYAEEVLHLGTKPMAFEEKLAMFLGTNVDDLPPNIPEELTPELLDYLLVLHELEHATQLNIVRKVDGSIDLSKITSSLLQPDVSLRSTKDSGGKLIAEVDADGAVQAYLHEEGLDNVAQFFMDARSANFFDVEHDISLIASHYKETGEVIDPSYYLGERMKLMALVAEKAGIGFDIVNKVFSKYPKEVMDRLDKDSALQDGFEKIVRSGLSRKVLYVGQELLDKGALQGVLKLKVEGYVGAMARLGYKPDPEPVQDYEQKVQDFMTKHFGLPPSDNVEKQVPLAPDSPAFSNKV